MKAASYTKTGSLRLALAQLLFHLICIRQPTTPAAERDFVLGAGADAQRRFFARFAGLVDFKGQRVLDVGCGYGPTCVYMARHGAREVLGIDIEPQRIARVQAQLAQHPELAGRLHFRHTQRLTDLGQRQFDLIISKDSFEHISDPEEFIADIPQISRPAGCSPSASALSGNRRSAAISHT